MSRLIKLKKPMQLKKLAMSLTSCANTALLITLGAACKPVLDETNTNKQVQPVAEAAIYEKNNGRQPVQAKLLAEIAAAYAKLGQQDKASKLLAPAIQTIKINKSIRIKTDLLEQLGIIYIEMRQYDKALQVAKSLYEYQSLNPYVNTGLQHIATQFIQVGQYEKALQLIKLKTYLYSTYQSILMSEIGLKYAQTGQKAQAQQILAQALKKAKSSTYEIQHIALKYAQFGQKAKALQLLAQASQNLEYPDDIAEMAVKYGQLGQKDKAEQLLTQALQKVRKPNESVFIARDYHLTKIAIAYAEIGQFIQAIETAKTINYPGSDVYNRQDISITPEGLKNGTS